MSIDNIGKCDNCGCVLDFDSEHSGIEFPFYGDCVCGDCANALKLTWCAECGQSFPPEYVPEYEKLDPHVDWSCPFCRNKHRLKMLNFIEEKAKEGKYIGEWNEAYDVWRQAGE